VISIWPLGRSQLLVFRPAQLLVYSTAHLLQYRSSCYSAAPAYLSAKASTLPIDPDTITVVSVASGIALSDLLAALTTVQAAAAASCERAAAVEGTSQQEQAAMAAMAATTSGAAIAPTALKLQLADVLRVAAPSPRPATAAASAPVAPPG
jgi:hypothetical protein